jgi:hypothetical protein
MKIAELFEMDGIVKNVSAGKINLDIGQPDGVKVSIPTTTPGGSGDTRFDSETGVLSQEPTEAEETKLAHELVGQIGEPLYVQEQPLPAKAVMYIVASNEELAAHNISQTQENTIKGGGVYVLNPNNLTYRPERIDWTNHFVFRGRGIELGKERSSALQARAVQQHKGPISIQP